MQGLTQASDTIVLGHTVRVTPGDRNQPASPSSATVQVTRVIVGDPALAGRVVTVVHSASDQPLAQDGKTRLFFVAHDGDRYRLAFFHTYGALPVEGDKLAIWLSGKPHGQFYPLADVLSRIAPYSTARIVWSATVPAKVARAQGTLRIAFVARNVGRQPTRVLLPPHHFDAVWAQRLGPDGKQAVGDWSGVGHWDHAAPTESPPTLPPGRDLRREYAIPLAALGMAQPGLYRVIVRLEGHRRSTRGEQAAHGPDLRRFWLGGLAPQSTDVTVE